MSACVLIFDSGVGGLSISDEIAREHPNCKRIYCSDNAYFPYGTKPETELIARIEKVLGKVIEQETVDIIVVACNSASTLALEHLRSRFNTPIVGVVPAIKPAAAKSLNGKIGLLATEATVNRPYTDQLIQDFAQHCQVFRLGTQSLVRLAESKLRGEKVSSQAIDEILRPLFYKPDQTLNPIDVLVLACTHFPLLKEEINQWLKQEVAHNVTLVDSGKAIANRVGYWLDQISQNINTDSNQHSSTVIFTQIDNDTTSLMHAMDERHYTTIKKLDI